jgi:cobalt-zinc-cadmium efflux system protein
LSLITDAVHNFQDVISLIIALIAAIWMSKKPTETMTFGYLRAEAMAGFVNALFLIGAVFFIIFSGIERIINPENVEGIYVIIVGFIAFVLNTLSVFILGFHHHHNHSHNHDHNHHKDLNISAAYLHLLSDAGISLAVVIGGIFIYFFHIYWIDPVISIIFSLYILKETIPIIQKSYKILMEGVPDKFDINEIKKEIEDLPVIIKVHDIHIWALSSNDIYFSAHIIVPSNINMKELEDIIKVINSKLRKKGINHITIQPELSDFKCENIY